MAEITALQQPQIYRASEAPLFDVCPAAAWSDGDEVLVNPVDEAGTLGTAVHEACAAVVRGETPPQDAIVRKYGLDAAQERELRILAANAGRFWREYGPQFAAVVIEPYMAASNVTGHADVIGSTPSVLRVLDWKTTRLEAVNYRPQMMEYLWLLSKGMDVEDRKLQYIICFLRDKTIEVSDELTAEQVCAWHAEYMAKIAGWDRRTYCPGGHCWYCPRRAACPALRADLSQATDSFAVRDGERAIAALPDERKVDLWDRIGAAVKLLEHARDIIKLHAEAAGGTLQGDGKALVLRDQSRQTIKAKEAWPILLKHLTEAELAPCVSVHKGDVLEAVGAKAPRGHKKRIKEQLVEELEAVNAVETSTFKVARIVAALPVTETEIGEDDNGTDNESTDE